MLPPLLTARSSPTAVLDWNKSSTKSFHSTVDSALLAALSTPDAPAASSAVATALDGSDPLHEGRMHLVLFLGRSHVGGSGWPPNAPFPVALALVLVLALALARPVLSPSPSSSVPSGLTAPRARKARCGVREHPPSARYHSRTVATRVQHCV